MRKEEASMGMRGELKLELKTLDDAMSVNNSAMRNYLSLRCSA